MFLITTADQRYWRVDGKVLFLGDWCKVYDQEKIWSTLDYEVMPYHWDDRSKLYKDYKYINELYERVLIDLASALNKLHNIDYSIRYWRIIVGPWLHSFLRNFYDRYLSISSVIQSGHEISTLLPGDLAWVVPDDFNCFNDWLQGHGYNIFLYSQLIKDLGGLNYETIDAPLNLDNYRLGVKNLKKNTVIKFVGHISRMVPNFLNEIVFITSYIKPMDLFRLQISLGQIPYFCANEMVELKPLAVDESMRIRIQIQAGSGPFESLLPGWISRQIPKVHVEGYSHMVRRAREKYPKRPKVIVTSNALYGQEGFKAWAGENVEKGAKWVGTQHGGAHGISLWSASETHETKVADKYFTWGWKGSGDQTTVPLASARLNWGKRKIQSKPSGRILWVGSCGYLYSDCCYSSPMGPQYVDYIDDQKSFIQEVCPSVRKLLLLRLYPRELGWHEDHMWQHLDSPPELYRGAKSSFDQLNESRLSIGTYNGTGILETLSANFPTIIFWNPNHWELRESAKPVFEALLDAGIFHETPQSAASKVNEIYQNVQSWWMLPEVQTAKDQFCDHFANTSKPLLRLKEELLRLM